MKDYVVYDACDRAREIIQTCDSKTMIYDDIELKCTYIVDMHRRLNLSVKVRNWMGIMRELDCELCEDIEHELRALNHEIFAVN